jgi:hypothetical protein
VTEAPADRVRKLLLRGDNVLKTQGRAEDSAARVDRARAAFADALEVARDPAVDPRVRELVERRLAALDAEDGNGADA